MALTGVNGFSALPQQRGTSATPTQAPPAAEDGSGTLYVVDSFRKADDHGYGVIQAARNAGFQGQIQGMNYGATAPDLAPGGAAARKAAASQEMSDPSRTPKQFLASFDQYAGNAQTAFLHGVTQQLKTIDQQGAHDSAVNLSQNMNKAEIFGQMAEKLNTDPAFTENAIKAFGADRNQVFSQDAAVASSARTKLYQAMLDRVDRTVDHSPSSKQAKAEYDQTVATLAQKNVSVVVSSGNEGRQIHDLEQVNAMGHLKVPQGFYDNPLSNSQTTTVGEVNFGNKNRGQETGTIRDTSSPSKNVTLYADGELTPGGEHGTSFSAPAVAAGLAKEHAVYPGLSNNGALLLMKNKLSTHLPGISDPVLAPSELSQFLNTSTF